MTTINQEKPPQTSGETTELKGDTERGAAKLAEARRLTSDGRFSSLGGLKAAWGFWGAPSVRPLVEATLFVGLRKAGMPEE